MRGIVIGLALMLGACARESGDALAGCDLQAAREIAFSSGESADEVLTRAIGPSCDKAIGLFVLRTAEGYPVWSWSAPLAHRFGDVFAAEDSEHVQSFLDAWAQPEITTTQAAPAWPALAPGQTTLDQLTYEDVRARNLPMLCHFSGTARQTCVFWEPAAGGAGQLYDRDVEESQE